MQQTEINENISFKAVHKEPELPQQISKPNFLKLNFFLYF